MIKRLQDWFWGDSAPCVACGKPFTFKDRLFNHSWFGMHVRCACERNFTLPQDEIEPPL